MVLPNATSAAALATNKPTMKMRDLDDLGIDHSYQREFRRPTEKRIQAIVDEWSPVAAGFISVSVRDDGTSWVVDGQHRMEAMRRLGIRHWVCAEWHDLTHEQEAEMFVRMNHNTVKLQSAQVFRAMLEAHYIGALEVDQAVRDSYCQWGRAPGSTDRQPGDVSAYETMLKMRHAYGIDHVVLTLKWIRATWPNDPEATSASMLAGTAYFMWLYKYTGHGKEAERKLSHFPPGKVIAYAKALQAGEGGSLAHNIAKSLAVFYNKGRKSDRECLDLGEFRLIRRTPARNANAKRARSLST